MALDDTPLVQVIQTKKTQGDSKNFSQNYPTRYCNHGDDDNNDDNDDTDDDADNDDNDDNAA